MRRVLSVWFPSWSVDLARRRRRRLDPADERSILLVDVSAGRTLVTHCSRRAHERGVRAGMPLAEARPLLSPEEPRVEHGSPARDLRQLRRMGTWAMRFSPVVALDPPDGLLLDIAGSRRLFGDEEGFLSSIASATRRLGFGLRLAAAHTVGAAWAVSRFGPEPRALVPRGGEREAIQVLPVEALRIVDEAAENLRELGITTIGKLLELPRKKLSSRFGEELLLRVDQALGRIAEPVPRLEWRAPLVVERVFDGLVTNQEALTRSVRNLLAALLIRLRAAELGATEIQLRICPSDLAPRVHTLPLSRPTQDLTLLEALARPPLEGTDMGFGVERVVIEATATSPMQARQGACWNVDTTNRGPNHELSALLDVLSSRFAPDQLLQPYAHESHVPERAFASTPFAAATETRRSRVRARVTASDRPSMLFPAPEPLVVEPNPVPDEAPLSFSLRGSGRNRVFHVASARGPERIEAPWWEGQRSVRDYFRVDTSEKRTFWIYRERGGREARWFLHGEWA